MLATRDIWCQTWKWNNSHISFQNWRKAPGTVADYTHLGSSTSWPGWCDAAPQIILPPAPIRSDLLLQLFQGMMWVHVHLCAERHQLLPDPYSIRAGDGKRQMQAPICLAGSSWLCGDPVHQCRLPFALALNHIQLSPPSASLADPKAPGSTLVQSQKSAETVPPAPTLAYKAHPCNESLMFHCT